MTTEKQVAEIKIRERVFYFAFALILTPIVILFFTHLVPSLIRKNTISFIPADKFPHTGVYISANQDGHLVLSPIKLDGQKGNNLFMEYKSNQNSLKIVFAIEEWKQLLMREQDKRYGANSALRALHFLDEAGNIIKFPDECRLIGSQSSFGGASHWRYGINKPCSAQNNVIKLEGDMHGNFKIFCVKLQIMSQDKIYTISHRSQDSRCLKRVE